MLIEMSIKENKYCTNLFMWGTRVVNFIETEGRCIGRGGGGGGGYCLMCIVCFARWQNSIDSCTR